MLVRIFMIIKNKAADSAKYTYTYITNMIISFATLKVKYNLGGVNSHLIMCLHGVLLKPRDGQICDLRMHSINIVSFQFLLMFIFLLFY